MKLVKIAASVAAVPLFAAAPSASAAAIGADGFDYPDGPLVGNAGGTGWHWNNAAATQGPAGSVSTWENSYESGAAVAGGAVLTQNNGPTRHFNADQGVGALQGTGTVFFATDMTYAPGATWLGLSAMDFGGERVKFGALDTDLGFGTRKYFGVEAIGAENLASGWTFAPAAEAVAGQTYRVVGSVDFNGDALRLWINPSAGDGPAPTCRWPTPAATG